MMAPERGDSGFQEVDAALKSWRQGDCVLGENWFVHKFEPSTPLTTESESLEGDGGTLVESAVVGIVVLTQTCDIARSCSGPNPRPFIEVAPLVEVSDETARQSKRGWTPRYAFVPALADQNLVADLDRTMTVEKAVVAGWQRVQGCHSDGEARVFAQALARKRVRVALPDDFTAFIRGLQNRIKEKHDRQSPEGQALRSLREIRVRASPSWASDEVSLFIWFIKDDSSLCPEGIGWDGLCASWLGFVQSSGRFKEVAGVVAELEDISAREYVDSDPLDLDHLSIGLSEGQGDET